MTTASQSHAASQPTAAPQAWPLHVPPPGAAQWQRHALNWLLDLCPPDYRAHPVLLKQPLLLAHMARMHVLAQLRASSQARATLRERLQGRIEPEALEEALTAIAMESDRLTEALTSLDAVGVALSAELQSRTGRT